MVKKKPNPSRLHLTLPEKTLLVLISTCALCICIAAIAINSFDPERDAKTTIAQLASQYYADYLYPNANGAADLADFATGGLPAVRLRQLLLYTGSYNTIAATHIFSDYYSCDPNSTLIRFFPTAPYGPRDYTITYDYHCEKSVL